MAIATGRRVLVPVLLLGALTFFSLLFAGTAQADEDPLGAAVDTAPVRHVASSEPARRVVDRPAKHAVRRAVASPARAVQPRGRVENLERKVRQAAPALRGAAGGTIGTTRGTVRDVVRPVTRTAPVKQVVAGVRTQLRTATATVHSLKKPVVKVIERVVAPHVGAVIETTDVRPVVRSVDRPVLSASDLGSRLSAADVPRPRLATSVSARPLTSSVASLTSLAAGLALESVLTVDSVAVSRDASGSAPLPAPPVSPVSSDAVVPLGGAGPLALVGLMLVIALAVAAPRISMHGLALSAGPVFPPGSSPD